MRQGRKPAQIKDLIKAAVKSISEKGPGIYEEDIRRVWQDAAGDGAARHSTPRQLKGSVLTVSVDSPTWIYQLSIKKRAIEKRLSVLLKSEKPITVRLRAGED